MSDDDFQWQNPSARNMRDDSVYEGEVIGGGLSDWSKFVTHLMDDLIKVPGTNLGIGLDGLLGLIPCVGDAATTVTSGSLFFEAIRNRVPLVVIARMALNIIIDALLGAIPLIGDVADIAHKANRKNLKLINKAIEDRDHAARDSKIYLIVASVIAVGTILLLLAGFIAVIWALFNIKIG